MSPEAAVSAQGCPLISRQNIVRNFDFAPKYCEELSFSMRKIPGFEIPRNLRFLGFFPGNPG